VPAPQAQPIVSAFGYFTKSKKEIIHSGGQQADNTDLKPL